MIPTDPDPRRPAKPPEAGSPAPADTQPVPDDLSGGAKSGEGADSALAVLKRRQLARGLVETPRDAA